MLAGIVGGEKMKRLDHIWKWLGKNKDALLLVGAALGGLAGAYKFFVEPRMTATIEYSVCRGENIAGCLPTAGVLIGCEPIESWAADRCKSFEVKVLQSHSGGHCGYETAQIKCEVKR